MAEQTTVKVPIEIQPPQQQQTAEKPAWARRSMHNVRMPRREVEYQAEWRDNGPNVELAWRPVEQSAEPNTSPMGEVMTPPQSYQPQGVNFMEQNQSGNQQPQAPQAQAPSPENYDLFDPMGILQFQNDTHAYMQSQVDARVQAALQPHMGALREAQLRSDYNAAVERYGQDDNFQQCMEVALENCAELDKAGKPFDIVAEYQKANDKAGAKPGQRGNAHLPEAFRGKKGIGSLGKIMFHNQQTGRAKPFGGRNWKG